MTIVVDASVIIAVLINEPGKHKLIELTRGANLIAPHSVHWEIGNAFSAMLKRKRITPEQMRLAIREYEKIPIQFVDIELEPALDIAAELGIYAYDAYLIWCALKYDSPLLSLDQSLVTLAQQKHVQVLEV